MRKIILILHLSLILRGGSRQMLAEKFIKSAVVYLIIGLALGIYMGISKDHSQMPAHAHLNLLGWVTMGLMGIVYKVWPQAAAVKLATLTYWLAHISVIGMTVGLILLFSGHTQYEFIAVISAIVVIVNIILFASLLYRRI